MQPHEHARHQGKVIRHVALVAVPEIGAHVGRPLVGFREQHAVRPARLDVAPDRLQDGVRLGQILAAGALTLDEVRHGVEAKAVDPQLQPEVHDLQQLLAAPPDCRN